MPIKNIIKDVSKIIGLFIAMLVVLELALFWAKTSDYLKFHGFDVSRGFTSGSYEKDPLIFWKFRPNQKLTMTYEGDPVPKICYTNGSGLRDRDFSLEKNDNILRIVCIGDSWTWGDGVEQQETYPKQLESLLRSRGYAAEVINAGVPGYSSFQGLRFLKREMIRYRADILIIFFGMDDAAPAFLYEDSAQRIIPEKDIRFQNILMRSKALHFLNITGVLLKRKLFYNDTIPFSRVNPLELEANFEAMFRIARNRGMKVIILNYPLPSSAATSRYRPTRETFLYNKIIRRWADKRDVVFVDNEDLFTQFEPAAVFHPMKDSHPNAFGYNLIVQNIYQALMRWDGLSAYARTAMQDSKGGRDGY